MQASENPETPGPPDSNFINQQFERLIESLEDHAVFMIDVTGTITSWNPGVERVLGYSQADFVGLPFATLFTPEDRENGRPAEELQRAAATGLSDDKREHVRSDGRRFRADGVVTVIRDAAGITQAFSKVMHDVTSQHQAVEALRESEERYRLLVDSVKDYAILYTRAQEANRLKDEFLGTVSHELKTPLNAILGWAHLLDMDDLKLDETKQRRAVRAIARNAQMQVELVNDLLDVSRIISGKMRLRIGPTDLPAVLNAAVEALQPAAQAKMVNLSVTVAAGTAAIQADQDRLQQVIWNLLANAIKFTPAGGRVDLHTGLSNQGAEIIVSDTGAGIAPEILPFIFDRFRQADSSTTRAYGGMGLGLAIVRHLVELHGGHVAATSAGRGRGATFTVWLPAIATTAPPLPSERAHAVTVPLGDPLPTLANLRVVIVDDDQDGREVLAEILSLSGAEVLAADSAARGLTLIEKCPPDVIVADIGMPDEDGYAFIEKVRRLAPARATPAIALTAYARNEDGERALEAGYQMHVPKPFDPRTIVEAVYRAVRSA
jgi:PAS domain S-box-containing protein